MSTNPRREFESRFPTEEACLEHLFRTRFGDRFNCPRCDRSAKYYRVKARRSYECEHCAYQLYPTAGTPFDKTRTPLRDWFFVMHLFCTTRNGVAAKEVQRQLGVTYKTAWRMCYLIRFYMGFVDGDDKLGGPNDPIVEIDETFIGGKDKQGEDDKAIVLGMTERKGDVITRVIPDRSEKSILPHIKQNVKPGSWVATDEHKSYKHIARFDLHHETVNHSEKEYVRGVVHTNTIESFWASVKRGINGTYVWVSKKHLPVYLREFEFRHNLRSRPDLMLEALLRGFPKKHVPLR